MTRQGKLKARILARPPDIDFDALRAFLEAEGWTWQLPRAGGSHHHFWKEGVPTVLSIPTVGGRKVKRAYIALVIKTLGLTED